jgi:uncharacterized protein (TIGR03086 family)
VTEVSERYRRLAGETTDTVRAVPSERWSSPSPCDGWTARDVVRHLVDTHGMFLGFVGGTLGDIPSVDDDPLGAWEAARDALQGALDDPARAEATFEGVTGRSTLQDAVGRFICFDQVVHRWDLARAAGIDVRIDADELDRLMQAAEGFGDAMRGPGAFGPAIEPPSGADQQTRVLAFLGRRAW